MTLSGQPLLQTLEPKLFYVYIPTRNQNQLPVFDSALQNTNFATLYTENQFSGNDRINDANQITTGITSRLLQTNGVERVRVGLAQRFYFKSQEVTLPGVTPRGSNNSDLLAALAGTIIPHWTADLGWQYTTDLSQTQRLNAGVRYEPQPGKVVNVAYRYTSGGLVSSTGTTVFSTADNPSNTLRQTDISTQWPLTRQLSAIARMGCHPLSVVTAVTIQDTMGVEEVMPLDAEWVADQARCVLEDMPVAAFKIGLLGSTENISAIAEVVSDYPEIPLVLDPVLASGRGDELVTDEMITAVRELLIPQTTIITPNSIEARRLVQEDGEDDLDLAECARRLLAMGCEYVLITGTHENTAQVVNTLYGQDGVVRADSWDRLPGSYHGSGCTLASAIAATIANGLSISDAVKDAQEYTWQTLKSAFRPGMSPA